MVRTDQNALWWILTLANATDKLARCCFQLMEYSSDLVHRNGVKHQAPDALSRLLRKGMEGSNINDEIPEMVITTR